MASVERAAADGSNLVPPVLAAVEARATLGEISDAMRRVFGEHRDQLA
jgi:methylmalonyl-CoA mutase N-terminal domain/subunit